MRGKNCNNDNAKCFFPSRTLEIQTKYETWGSASSFNFFGRCFQHTVKCFCLFAESLCSFHLCSVVVSCSHTHWALFADSGFVIFPGQSFEAVPAPERSELIILTSYSPPSRLRCTPGTENSFVESLCRTWRIRKCLKSNKNDFWNQPQTRSAALFSEQWSGNEIMGLKLADLDLIFKKKIFFRPREEENPRNQIGQHSRSWWGVKLYITNMIFYAFDRMYIYATIFHPLCQGHLKSSHLDLRSKSSHVGTRNDVLG